MSQHIYNNRQTSEYCPVEVIDTVMVVRFPDGSIETLRPDELDTEPMPGFTEWTTPLVLGHVPVITSPTRSSRQGVS